jgi:uncharacterized tellurite resistance protein B-like protein
LIVSVMSWCDRLEFLGHRRRTLRGQADSVRRIALVLLHLSPERGCFLAAFVYVLTRVACADGEISDAETRQMVAIMKRVGELSTEHAIRIVEIAKAQNRAYGGTENFLVTRDFRRMAPQSARLELLDRLFMVAAADDGISSAEEAQIRQVAKELCLSHHHYSAVRMNWSHERNVLRSCRESALLRGTKRDVS